MERTDKLDGKRAPDARIAGKSAGERRRCDGELHAGDWRICADLNVDGVLEGFGTRASDQNMPPSNLAFRIFMARCLCVCGKRGAEEEGGKYPSSAMNIYCVSENL